MRTETVETLAEVGNRTTGAGTGVWLLGWVSSSEFLGVLGVAIALAGMLVNWYYRRQANIRANHVYLLQAERLRRGSSTPSDFDQLESDE